MHGSTVYSTVYSSKYTAVVDTYFLYTPTFCVVMQLLDFVDEKVNNVQQPFCALLPLLHLSRSTAIAAFICPS